MEKSSPIEPPKIDVKEGGKVSGYGEKFEVNLVSGTPSFSFPVVTPEIRDTKASVSLNYNGAKQNGPYGIGFSVKNQTVSRLTDKGVPRYDSKDRFQISGTELTPKYDLGDGEWVKDERHEADYTVIRYRQRTETTFNRIEWWVHASGDTSYWRVVDSENATTIFGRDRDSQIFDPDSPERIFQWSVESETDAEGNKTLYKYKREDGENLPELNGHSVGTQLYIASILYGNYLTGEGKEVFAVEVAFDYGNYDLNDSPVEPVRPWTVRADPFSTFRPGFELRTWRLCHNILTILHYPDQPEVGTALNGLLAFVYDDGAGAARLKSAQHIGYRKEKSGDYSRQARPPMTFSFGSFAPPSGPPERLRFDHEPAAAGVLGRRNYSFVDLFGDGLPGILFSQNDTLEYWPSNGDGSYAPPVIPLAFPVDRSLPDGRCILMDIDGNGHRDLVVRSPDRPGYYRNNNDGTWETFVPFASSAVELTMPEAQMADLNGDGRQDLFAQAGMDMLRVYESRGRTGYGEPALRPVPRSFPTAVSQSEVVFVGFANVFGDGLGHRVRLADGNIEIWPSLGFGRFAEPIVMTKAPSFGPALTTSRIFFADVTGSGFDDLVLTYKDHLAIHLNENGNAFSDAIVVPIPQEIDDLDQVSWADVLGLGRAAFVLSKASAETDHFYLAFGKGQSVDLLTAIDNNCGNITELQYRSSTAFQIADKFAGRPWATSLSMVVQVLEEVSSTDKTTGLISVNRYQYADGYYDPVEREFRGFGYVQSQDTQIFNPNAWHFSALRALEAAGEEADPIAPRLSRRWNNTGAAEIEERRSVPLPAFDGQNLAPPNVLAEDILSAGARTVRDAYRSLKDREAANSVYGIGDDDVPDDVPYLETGQNYAVTMLQPRLDGNPGSFLVTHRQSRSVNYERSREDAMVEDKADLAHDAFGNTTLAVTVNYPRPGDPSSHVPQQLETKVVATGSAYVNHVETVAEPFRYIGLKYEDNATEIGGLESGGGYFTFAVLEDKVDAALEPGARVPYGQPFSPGELQSRRFHWGRTYFWNGDRTAPLLLGRVAAETLIHHEQSAVFPESFVTEVYGSRVTPSMLEPSGGKGAGYLSEDGHWWNPGSVRSFGGADTFFSPVLVTDAFGAETKFGYDPYFIHITETTDALGQAAHMEIDYQAHKPWRILDTNDNAIETAYDSFGDMVAFSRHGSLDGRAFGDSSLKDYTYVEPASLDEIIADPEKFLQGSGSYYYEDYAAFGKGEGPVNSIHIEASRYETPLDPSEPGARQYDISLTFVDGSFRTLAKQQMVDADACDGVSGPAACWVTTEQVTYNKKGEVVRRYNPYFADVFGFVANPAVPFELDFYDAMGRKTRVDTAKGFFKKTEYQAWKRVDFDEDDTVKDSPYYKNNIGNTNPDFANERNALEKAAIFEGTPTTFLLDPMGRDVVRREISLYAVLPDPAEDSKILQTGIWYDIAGNSIREVDPRFYEENPLGLANFVRVFDMSGKQVSAQSTDRGKDSPGTSLQLADVTGKPLHEWSNRGFHQSWQYDVLRRPLGVEVEHASGTFLAESLVYGTDPGLNTRNQIVVARDQAQVSDYAGYDLQGKPVSLVRRFPIAYEGPIDWTDPSQVPLLPDNWTESIIHNRREWPLLETNADGSVQATEYYMNGWRKAVAIAYTPGDAPVSVSTGARYAADGSQVEIAYANNTVTRRSYDPDDMRLTAIITERTTADSATIQDDNYYYDPVGNVTRIVRNAAPPDFFRNGLADPLSDYTYDSIYRLRLAKGRQQALVGLEEPGDPATAAALRGVRGADGDRLVPYTEAYTFDASNNLTQIRHIADIGGGQGAWTRNISVSQTSNHAVPEDMLAGGKKPDDFYDAGGNLGELPNLRQIDYSYRNKMTKVTVVERSGSDDDEDYFTYGKNGNRRRKVVVRQVNGGAVREVQQTFYIGNYILVRTTRNGAGGTAVTEETSSLRVMAGSANILIANRDAAVGAPQLLRYQVANNQKSVQVELDETGQLITYEEFFPFGTTAIIGGKSERDITSKRFRFVAKELDRTTGLYCIGVRYYVPWMGRWTTPDPIGAKDGLNLYAYVGGNPLSFTDPTGGVRTRLLGAQELVARRQATMNTDLDRALNMVDAAIDLLQGHVTQRYGRIWSALGQSGTISAPDPLVQQYFGIEGTGRTDANNLIEILDNFKQIRTYLARPAVESRLSWRYVKSFFVNTPQFRVLADTRASRGTIAYVQGAQIAWPDWRILPPSVRSRPAGPGAGLLLAGTIAPFSPAVGAVAGIAASIPFIVNTMVSQMRRMIPGGGINLYDRKHFNQGNGNVRSSTIVHEASHLVLGTDDHAYAWEGQKFTGLTPTQTMYNADSYGLFAKAALRQANAD